MTRSDSDTDVKHRQIILKGASNFVLWRQEILEELQGYGLHKYALGRVDYPTTPTVKLEGSNKDNREVRPEDGGAPSSTASSPTVASVLEAQDAWERKDAQTKMRIRRSLSDTIRSQISESITTSKGLMDFLQIQFTEQGFAKRVEAQKTLNNCSIASYKYDIYSYTAAFNSAVSKLETICRGGGATSPVDGSYYAAQFLIGLHDDKRSNVFISTYFQQSGPWTPNTAIDLHGLQSQIQSLYRRENWGKQNTTAAKATTPQFSKGASKKGSCSIHPDKPHSDKECFTQHPELHEAHKKKKAAERDKKQVAAESSTATTTLMAATKSLTPSSSPSSTLSLSLRNTALYTRLPHSAPWAADSGTTDHICNDISLFDTLVTVDPIPVTLADDSTAWVTQKGNVPCYFLNRKFQRHKVILTDVLLLPQSPVNLFSISKIAEKAYFTTRDNTLRFRNSHIEFGHVVVRQGLYILQLE